MGAVKFVALRAYVSCKATSWRSCARRWGWWRRACACCSASCGSGAKQSPTDEGAPTVTYLAVTGTLPAQQEGNCFWLCAPKECAAWHGVADGVQAASDQICNLSLTWVDAN